MRLIDADALKKFEITMKRGDGYSDFVFASDIHQAPTIDAVPAWIPVTERLPEIGTYIIAGRMKYVYEKEYTHFVDAADFGPRWNDADCSWQTFNDWYEGQQEFEITHWMPLPEPPKGGE